ncbi:MAG: 1-(5-phosphoribosyl)-5-[(5-phosphoribosylamino)methylideneamino]imidazole-4-carboxamide isomerase [Christensenellales bacterium]|jgi:phosphoribosylformimino-5-aminoimidazole carboxamide ribotide isomerase
MIIFPAIDIKNKKCVRLLQGRAQDETVYGDPVQMAQKWQALGARYLHVVDLDGAFEGVSRNLPVVRAIVEKIDIPVQLGGGIRSMEDVEERMQAGVRRVILGTAAIENEALLKEAAQRYPGRIAVGIDAKNGVVATRGWLEDSGIEAYELALRVKEWGIDTVIYTDIEKDGMLTGPNFEATRKMMDTGLQVVASGGVSSLEDISRLKKMGVYGVITGKALYDGKIDLARALAL